MLKRRSAVGARWFRHLWLVTAAFSLLAGAAAARAQDYPNRPVKIIVPFPAGGTADAVRSIAEWLSPRMGAAGGDRKSDRGCGKYRFRHRLSRGAGRLHAAFRATAAARDQSKSLSKSFLRRGEVQPIIVMAQVPNSIIVNPGKIGATTVPEFIAYLKANPGKVTSATQGNGTTSHLTSEMLQLKGQVQVQHVPYRGTAPALQDLLSGNVDFMCDNLGVSLPLVEAGKLRLLGVATTKRMASLPNVPTIAETLPGFESVAWYAVVAPPKTPRAITEKINADINEALRHPELQDRLKKLSAEVVGGSVDETAKYLREEVDRWNAVIKEAKIKLQ